MWVYIKRYYQGQAFYAVGFYEPGGLHWWHEDSEYVDPMEAAKRVHYLNGGNQNGQ